ncbi:MAG: hypothetical protein KDD15_22400, partial [Lewinella sp.]|nr:hypothetical protein [Lewinella sp.]
MIRISILFFLLTLAGQVGAQVSRIPLEVNPGLHYQRTYTLPKGYDRGNAKAACDPADPDKTYVEAGQMAFILTDID